MSAGYDWLAKDGTMHWVERSAGVYTLQIPREVLARRSGFANGPDLVPGFIAWAYEWKAGSRFCVAWDVDGRLDGNVLVARYSS